MSTPNDVAERLRRGIEAAREGKRAEAREFFEQVVEIDEKSEKGWFWLASVVDTDDERRICLSNVLHINPNNERARRALDALQAKAKEKKSAAATEEVVAGVSRRQLTMLLSIGGVAVIIILIIALVVIVGNNNRQNDERATAQAIAQAATADRQTATVAAEQATGTAVAATETQLAVATTVPSNTPTSAIATLPPTWTPTPEATLPPTRAVLPPPIGLSGRLAMWGGEDVLNTGYLPLGYYDFDFGTQFNSIGDSLGKDISFAPSGQRVIYTAYDELLFSSSIEAINLNGTQIESVPQRWTGQNIFSPQQPRYGGEFGQKVVFIATTDKRQSTQVFLLDMSAPEGTDPVRQMTDDDNVYTYPALSPDGYKIAVVRQDTNTANPTIDIVSIDANNGGMVPITSDGQSYTKSTPRWTADGSRIIFSAIPSNDPSNADIYSKNANGSGSSLPLYRSPANDIFPVMSPDGRYLAFASNSDGAYDIFILDQNDGTLSQLTSDNADEFPGDWWQQ